jgi:very-short-patch-repair endonuclease/NADPH-dependent glutamate synthase beta subunit-like oxidoreductase
LISPSSDTLKEQIIASYNREILVKLDCDFLNYLKQNATELHNRLVAARAEYPNISDKDYSQLIIDLAPHLEDFIAELFEITSEVQNLQIQHNELAPLYSCKRLFVQRRALKKWKVEDLVDSYDHIFPELRLKAHHSNLTPSLTGKAVLCPREGEGMPTFSPYEHVSPNSITIERAKELRRNQTDVEKKLWYYLRGRKLGGFRFRRQSPIGSYIADFVCPEAKLVIELDGEQHGLNISHDVRRTQYMQSYGYTVLRFWNNEVNQNFESVIDTISNSLFCAPLTPPFAIAFPPPLRGRVREGVKITEGVKGTSLQSFELEFAKLINAMLENEEEYTEQLKLAEQYAAWATLNEAGQERHKHGVLFKQPHKLDFDNLIPLDSFDTPSLTLPREGEGITPPPSTGGGWGEGQEATSSNITILSSKHIRHRDGFDLTDPGCNLEYALDQAGYCIFCHNQGKDSCSKGFREKDGKWRVNPQQITLAGCPLEEKISEMNTVKGMGYSIGALAIVCIDNPLCAATGHRICNDCMKSCIYQKQEPVNIPQIESRSLRDVLGLPWGFEIYSLLTRWNPLNLERPLPRPATGKRVLVVGMGPAGFNLAHHLLNDGHEVVGIDGLKIEPLDPAISGRWSVVSGQSLESSNMPNSQNLLATGNWQLATSFKPIHNCTEELFEKLSERVTWGFGGVAEYGITVRWDKNFLKLIRILLERRSSFTLHGGVRLGSNITLKQAFEQYGFDHVALCMGAGKPNIPDIPNALARGARAASDFLMALQLTGAAKKDSIANLQLRLPVVVIGGGLTAIDTATESLAYYPVQVEKFLSRYQALCALQGEENVRRIWNAEELIIADEFIAHAQALRSEKVLAQTENRQPKTVDLIKSWGGVKVCYRKSLQDSPAYRLNHEEVALAMEEGIEFCPNLEPKEILLDEYGHVNGLVFLSSPLEGERDLRPATAPQIREGNTLTESPLLYEHDGSSTLPSRESLLPARAILYAIGTSPNTVLAREEENDGAVINGKYFQAINVAGDFLEPELNAKPASPSVLMHKREDGRFVSFFGDLHPSYAGNVVKAMASAKQGYGIISKVLEN